MHVSSRLRLLVVAVAFSAVSVRADDRLNVLILFTDDQRADAIGAWGNEHLRTPNLDRLAARGVSFRRNYCFGSRHGAVCVPSRAMLMTGRHLFAVDDEMTDAVTFPQLLREQGYTTFAVGKWHNREPSLVKSFERGRSLMMGGMSDHHDVPLHDLIDGRLVERPRSDQHSSEIFADAAVEFLSGHDGGEPFVCYVAFTAPHDPRDPPPAYREEYYARRPPLPANFLPSHPFENGQLSTRDEQLAPFPRSRAVVSDQLAEYYGLITHLDEQIGRVLEALEASPHADNTLIVYASDHGLALGSHGLLGKQNLYEHSMRCPMIWAGPGVPAGQSTEAFTYLFDVYPTLCERLGVEPPVGIAGKSLTPLMDDPDASLRDSVFLAYRDLMRAVRDERWKLIEYPQVNHTQLFDLREDPHETENLAARPAHRAEVARLREAMKAWQARCGDDQPLRVEEPKPLEVDLTGRRRSPDRWQPDWIVSKYFGASRDAAAAP